MKPFIAAVVLCTAACAASAAPGQEATGNDTAAVTDLVHQFVDAEMHVDGATLRGLTAEQFVEISPLGAVDPRDKWLGFYKEKVAEAKAQATFDESMVRQFGDTAILTARVTFSMVANAVPRSSAGRMSFVAHKEGAQWKLVSAQFTPIRPPKT